MEQQTEKRCPNCGQALECKLEHFSIGADGGGGLITFFSDQYVVDLYACPHCGKVELFTADFGREPFNEEDDYITCPVCEARHSPLIGCPRCALHGRPSSFSMPKSPKTDKPKKEKRPPWEK